MKGPATKTQSRLSKEILSKEILSRLEQVDGLCQEIRSVLKEAGLEPDAFGVELVARECLNNAVLHGSRGDNNKRVQLELVYSRGKIRLRIADEGPGFDWKKALQTKTAKRDATSGRGLRILNSYAERFRFNRRGNQITLWLPRVNPQKTV